MKDVAHEAAAAVHNLPTVIVAHYPIQVHECRDVSAFSLCSSVKLNSSVYHEVKHLARFSTPISFFF